LIPGRPYPVQVYLYACGLYCSEPAISQRTAAESTRKRFGLGTFSHSTVSRSFRSIENAVKQSLKNKFGEEGTVCCRESAKLIRTAVKIKKNEESSQREKRFPKSADTAARREAMHGFFPNRLLAAKRRETEYICIEFMVDWHERVSRLLL